MGRRALVVDDDDTMRFVLGEALRGSGRSVNEVDDGSAVLERLESDAHDLVVLDLYMPGMNEALENLRGLALARTASAGKIACSSGSQRSGSEGSER